MQLTGSRLERRLAQGWLVYGVCGRTARTALVRARQEVTKDDPNRSPRYDAQRARTGRFSRAKLLASVLHAASSIERCLKKDPHW